MNSRTFKDWFIIVLLAGSGVFYLFLQVLSIFQNGFTAFRSDGNNIMISRSEILYELRTWLTIVFCLAGGFLYYKFRKAGWVLAMGMMTLFVFIAAGGITSIFNMGLVDTTTYFPGLIAFTFLYAFILLLIPSTRKKFGLNRTNFLAAGIFIFFILLIYFVIQ